MRIVIETIPHRAQRYDTAGDWQVLEDGTWRIRVCELGNWKQEFLVALHELVELAICTADGITEAEVDDFDLNWKAGLSGATEPGDDLAAPYYLAHQVADLIERAVALELGVIWREYERAVHALEYADPQLSED